MDNLSAFGSQEPEGFVEDDDAGIEAPPEIGTDERRMHVRAYNYWASLLTDRAYPSIEDLDPESLEDFGPNSVLLDFTQGVNNPSIAWLGGSIRTECDIEGDIEDVAGVPARSLLSRLTDHYMQIIANQAPVGFEAEFVNHRGDNTMYRGILMPFSSDDDTIDFIYGVINWKVTVDPATDSALQAEVSEELDENSERAEKRSVPVWEDGPSRARHDETATPEADVSGKDEKHDTAELTLAVKAQAPDSLADYLVLARDNASEAKAANQRSRAALYDALGSAYDFALTADQEPEEYQELLDDAGITQQDRAPMTPVAKLVFGAEYDKTRLTEFATALTHAKSEGLKAGAFAEYLQGYKGGLKAIVAAERKSRRPVSKVNPIDAACAVVRAAKVEDFVTLDEDDGGTEEFVLMMSRRMPNGRFAVVGPVPHDKALTEKAIRKFAE